MKQRTNRLQTIKRIIREQRIDSQETLLKHLLEEGYNVTQATLSRDLKTLKVGKVSEGANGYHYTLPGESEAGGPDRAFLLDFQRGYVGIEFSGNIGVIRTLTGHADSVAIALDNLHIDEILGTVAGDDTVIVIFREGADGDAVFRELRTRFPELEG